MSTPERAWSFLVKGHDRQHGGNLGYDDLEESYYSFDSTVPNSRHVAAGHLAIVRDSIFVIGSAVIERVQQTEAAKIRRRCPKCESTDFKSRMTITPKYRCGKCRSEFPAPDETEIPVTAYRALYGLNWQWAKSVPISKIDAAYLGQAKQHAIRELDVVQAISAIGRH